MSDQPCDVLFNKNKEQKKLAISFWWNILGIFCCWSSYLSVFNLQSSINVEEGLGTNTLAISYFVCAAAGVIIAPIAIKKLGAKICVIIGDVSSFLFILANLYPKYYTLLTAALLMTTLQCAYFPSMSMLNVLYANLYSSLSKKSKDYHTIRFSGYFFTGFQCSQVFGNMLSYVILYGFDPISTPSEEVPKNCTSSGNNSCTTNPDRLQFCGAHDCQNATIIETNISQYKPLNPLSLYVLIGSAVFLELTGTLVHVFFVPSDKTFEKKTKQFEQEMQPLQEKPQSSGQEETAALMTDKTENDTEVKESGVLNLVLSTFKGVWYHCCQMKLLLLIPITFYNGLAMSFIFSEVTRSFTSCVIGVQWVGICMALFGVWDAIFSWFIGKFGRKVGRILLFTITFFLESGIYVFCLYWNPSQFSTLAIFGIFCLFGVTDGIYQTIINVTHIDYFQNNRSIGIPVWNMFVTLGFSTGMMLSRMMCVYNRIYLNLSVLLLGTILLLVAETLQRKTTKKAQMSTNEAT